MKKKIQPKKEKHAFDISKLSPPLRNKKKVRRGTCLCNASMASAPASESLAEHLASLAASSGFP